MTEQEIFNRLKRILKDAMPQQHNINKINIKDDLINDLGFNSIAVVYMAFAIEKEFNIDISKLSYKSFKTVNDVIKYIHNQLNNI